MKYYLDTEFIEGKQDKTIIGVKYGTTKNTIELISIGIVSENGREYYAISKDFNLKDAWNRYDLKDIYVEDHVYNQIKVYWIKDNVLRPIFDDMMDSYFGGTLENNKTNEELNKEFTYKNFKELLSVYGKSNADIAEDIKFFTFHNVAFTKGVKTPNPEFYGYYCDYDWVVFCWLFGKMINLPSTFPMYCIDLKQSMDEIAVEMSNEFYYTKEEALSIMKGVENYPKQDGIIHNALNDARWIKDLHKFLIE